MSRIEEQRRLGHSLPNEYTTGEFFKDTLVRFEVDGKGHALENSVILEGAATASENRNGRGFKAEGLPEDAIVRNKQLVSLRS